MTYYLFGYNPHFAEYDVTIGLFETKHEAEEALRRYDQAGWTELRIEEMDWL